MFGWVPAGKLQIPKWVPANKSLNGWKGSRKQYIFCQRGYILLDVIFSSGFSKINLITTESSKTKKTAFPVCDHQNKNIKKGGERGLMSQKRKVHNS